MSGWRSAELELIFGGTLDAEHLTVGAIQRLIVDGVSESDQLDFKRDAYPSLKVPGAAPPPWTSAHEFAKDVAAFANERGGLLILGLEDDKGVAKTPRPLAGIFEQDHQRLHQALLDYQSPLADCTILKIDGANAGEYFIAVVVPPSRRAPHAVVGRKGSGRIPLHYPVRRGQDNPCLTEHEVAERYRRRMSWQEDEERRVRRVVNEGRSALRRGAGSWLFVAVIPESPAEGVLDRSTAKEVEDWYRSGRGRSPLRSLFPAHGRAIPAPGRITFTGSVRADADDETIVRDGYVALYVDGTVFAAVPTKGRQADKDFGSVQDLAGLSWLADSRL